MEKNLTPDTKIPGQGLAVQKLREAGVKIFAEEDIDEAEAYLEELLNNQ